MKRPPAITMLRWSAAAAFAVVAAAASWQAERASASTVTPGAALASADDQPEELLLAPSSRVSVSPPDACTGSREVGPAWSAERALGDLARAPDIALLESASLAVRGAEEELDAELVDVIEACPPGSRDAPARWLLGRMPTADLADLLLHLDCDEAVRLRASIEPLTHAPRGDVRAAACLALARAGVVDVAPAVVHALRELRAAPVVAHAAEAAACLGPWRPWHELHVALERTHDPDVARAIMAALGDRVTRDDLRVLMAMGPRALDAVAAATRPMAESRASPVGWVEPVGHAAGPPSSRALAAWRQVSRTVADRESRLMAAAETLALDGRDLERLCGVVGELRSARARDFLAGILDQARSSSVALAASHALRGVMGFGPASEPGDPQRLSAAWRPLLRWAKAATPRDDDDQSAASAATRAR